ncbi:MAG: hypothetical protein A3C58_02655 [Candidatus Staskawiczbacteria bacterium RIFCSPHIGHO2_02_FULL_34_10]|uniref:Uncharacterized protein n=1 Tax=Candidatus Staskawiczbacteria bacterium RIFCSPHIGHO2_02_FULL_34_10 TaxID=1802205 RepID=A0A1G2HWJ0_9BACT|nr:MAG: hypothetical protein A3C58_02655 [Candidatus Staskawiczbacteria bacterium RIFCSPHIGHO2_02_FULL_34_10]
MIKKDYKNLWMSPNVVISRLDDLIKKYGLKTVIRKNEFRHEREGWIGGVFLLGLRELGEITYWLEIETEDSTPDVYGSFLDVIETNTGKKGVRENFFSIEIVEWEEHGPSIVDLIKNKCKKHYPNNYFLLVYVRRGGKVLDYEKIVEELKGAKIPFAQIWILVPSSNDHDYHLTKIYKGLFQIAFNLNDAIKKNEKQIKFATNMGKGLATEMENLGEISVPLPELEE